MGALQIQRHTDQRVIKMGNVVNKELVRDWAFLLVSVDMSLGATGSLWAFAHFVSYLSDNIQHGHSWRAVN